MSVNNLTTNWTYSMLITMESSNKIIEQAAEEFMEKFSIRPKFQSAINKEVGEHMPMILAANSAFFAVFITILLATKDNVLTASTLLVLIATIFTTCIIPLNIWYITRIKFRLSKLREEQEKMFAKTKEDVIQTLDLFSNIVRSGMLSQAKVLMDKIDGNEKLIEKVKQLGRDSSDYQFLIDKGYFFFESLNELSYYKTLHNYTEIMDSPLKEKWSTLKFSLDRLSDKLKNVGLVVNVVLLICTLLIITLLGNE